MTPDSVMAEITEHRINTVPNHQIHCPEIRRKQEDSDDHHSRGGLHFLERRRSDFLHLGAHVVVEGLDPLRPGLYPITEIVARHPQPNPDPAAGPIVAVHVADALTDKDSNQNVNIECLTAMGLIDQLPSWKQLQKKAESDKW